MDHADDNPTPPAPSAGAGAGPIRYAHAQTPEYRDASELFVLTDEAILLASSEEKPAAAAAKEAIDAGADPDAALAAAGFDPDQAKKIPLASVTKVVTFGDEKDLRVHWKDGSGAEKNDTAWLTNDTAKAAALAAVKGAIGPVTEHEEESSLLHVGTLPLLGIGAGVLLAVVTYLASMLASNTGGRRNALKRAIGLLNILPLWLWLAVSVLLIAASAFWWYTLSKDRPMKTTLTRTT